MSQNIPMVGPMIRVKSITEAWNYWYHYLNEQQREGFNQPSRAGVVVGEFINAITIIEDPRENVLKSEVRNLSMKYAIGELLWYLSGSNKLADIEPYAKFWGKISDDGETINSAYGYRIHQQFGFDQWEYVKRCLTIDQYSRQAIIHIKDASDEPTKDTPCTLDLQFLIRGEELHLTVHMRSNDIWLGFPYDVFAFTCLQIKMAMELGINVGTYTHIAGSLHLYQKDALKVEEIETY